MELRTVIHAEETLAARENVLATYVRLGLALPDAELEESAGCLFCRAPGFVAFGNFVGRFQGSWYDRGDLLEALRTSEALRAFVVTGDTQPDLHNLLLRAGFFRVHRLVSMAAPIPDRGWVGRHEVHAVTELERTRVAEFMAREFFGRSTASFRESVIHATVCSGLPLWCMGDPAQPIAAGMTSLTPKAAGIYNLCVRSDARRRGIGASMIRFFQNAAGQQNLPTVLQCDAPLASWYAGLGYQAVGEVISFARNLER